MSDEKSSRITKRLVDVLNGDFDSPEDLIQAHKQALRYLESVDTPVAYQQGREARQKRKPIDSCPYRSIRISAWWRAGWHDMDMEKGVTVLK